MELIGFTKQSINDRKGVFITNIILLFRSYAKCAKPKPWEDDQIKAYALCPWFADTDLFKASQNVNEIEKETREGLSSYFRVLTVKDVGNAFEEVLDVDKNGGVFIVFPDAPLIGFPELNQIFILSLMIYSKLVALCFPKWKIVNGTYAIPMVILAILATFYILFRLMF